jgi:mannose-6-phosphate isomerase-like protein (cupin superfamily)
MITQNLIVQMEDADWNSVEEMPGLRYKFLIDANHTDSRGLSLGALEVATGAVLPPHHHAPQEIYLFYSGVGEVILGDDVHAVKPGTAVFIPEHCGHGLINKSTEPLAFYWIFPTDSWEEIEYIFDKPVGD